VKVFSCTQKCDQFEAQKTVLIYPPKAHIKVLTLLERSPGIAADNRFLSEPSGLKGSKKGAFSAPLFLCKT
jgi:hypothetical protein